MNRKLALWIFFSSNIPLCGHALRFVDSDRSSLSPYVYENTEVTILTCRVLISKM